MILLISDLHLDGGWPQISERFVRFIDDKARHAEALYILGDLFEVWIGDDDDNPHYQAILNHIAELSGSGTAVYFMHGNRDFLFASEAAERARMQLLPDPYLITLPDGNKAVLSHGDHLCSDDHEYQTFRRMVRSTEWQQDFLAQSLEQRRDIVRELRQRSQQQTRQKADNITDVNQLSVEQCLSAYDCQCLIHGHTHRPASHHFMNPHQHSCERLVLGDWSATLGWYLRCDSEGCELLRY